MLAFLTWPIRSRTTFYGTNIGYKLSRSSFQVTYNTLLRARRRYGSLHEVQQCLSIYQDMRKAGYVKSLQRLPIVLIPSRLWAFYLRKCFASKLKSFSSFKYGHHRHEMFFFLTEVLAIVCLSVSIL